MLHVAFAAFFILLLLLRANRMCTKNWKVLDYMEFKWKCVYERARPRRRPRVCLSSLCNVKMAWILQRSLRFFTLCALRAQQFPNMFVSLSSWYRHGNLFNPFYLLNLDYNYGKYPFCIIPYSWNDFDIIIFSSSCVCLFWIYSKWTGCWWMCELF